MTRENEEAGKALHLFVASDEDAVDFVTLRIKTQARPSNLGHTPYQELSQA